MQMWTFYYDCCRTTWDLCRPKVKDSSLTVLRDSTCHVQCGLSGACSLKTYSCHRFFNELSHSLVKSTRDCSRLWSHQGWDKVKMLRRYIHFVHLCHVSRLAAAPSAPKSKRPLAFVTTPVWTSSLYEVRWHNIAAGSTVSALRSQV